MKKLCFLNNDDVVYPVCELKNIHRDAFMYNYVMLKTGLHRPIPSSAEETFCYIYSCIFNLRHLKSLGFEGFEVLKNEFLDYIKYCFNDLPENCKRLYECYRWE